MILFKPGVRIAKAVAANAGSYTMPTTEVKFPFGLGTTHLNEPSLRGAFGVPLVVLLGEADIDPNDELLPREPEAMAQGSHRFARGKTFFAAAKSVAAGLKTDYRWTLSTVPGVGHDNALMAPAAAQELFQPAASEKQAASAEQVHATIERSIPYIEEKGVWWITEKKCVTCHRTGNMVWSLAAARERGFAVSDKLDEWFSWSIEKSLAKNDQGKIDGTANKEGVAQLLLARDLFSGADRTETYQQLVGLVAEGQQADGAWKPGGQLPGQKRAAAETTDVTTMWLALALADASMGGDRPAELDKAIKHIEAGPPGKSTEWYAVRLLLALRLGDQATTANTIETLRSQQQADGGWGWIAGEESDALGTGLALYALLRANVGREDAAIQRGQAFLISTQREDGSWPVRGTKTAKKKNIEETAVYWGTAWAALALIESLPVSSNAAGE